MIVMEMVGWSAQLNVKVPGSRSVTGVRPPGAKMPELTVPAIVPGCGVLSVLTHATVDPRGTVSGLAGNALVVSSDPPVTTTIDRPGTTTVVGSVSIAIPEG